MSGIWSFFYIYINMIAAINVKCLDLFAGDCVKDILIIIFFHTLAGIIL